MKPIYEVTSSNFSKYGRIIDDIDFSSLITALKEIPISEQVVYEPSVAKLEQTLQEEDRIKLFGGLPMQIGYCAGHNTKLNAVEYHRNSEYNVAATDAILMLGCQQDITEECQYDTAKIETFFVPAGTTVELYATTLHYAPCQTEQEGFSVGILLPKGTNEALECEKIDGGEDKLLTAVNKWLIGHPEADLPDGTYLGLVGSNLEVIEEK